MCVLSILRGCNSPQIGLSIFVLLFFPGTHFQNFLLSLLDDSENSCHFQPLKTCSCLFQWARPQLHHLKPSQTLIPNFWNLNVPFVVTKKPSVSLICWSSHMFLETLLSFSTLYMQKYCQVPCNIFELWFIPFLAFLRNKIQRHI